MLPHMHWYVVVPILACTISAATAVTVLMRDPGNRRVWPIAGVSALAAVWAFCEIAWHVAATPEAALGWMRISAFGWVPIGPVAFHALMLARDRDNAAVRRWILLLYAGSGLLMAPALTNSAGDARGVAAPGGAGRRCPAPASRCTTPSWAAASPPA